MASRTLNITLNSGDSSGAKGSVEAPVLERQISSLTEAMSTFTKAVNDFTGAVKNSKHSSVEEQRTQRASIQRDTASIRAGVQTNPDIISQRTKQAESSYTGNFARLERERNFSALLSEGDRRLSLGDRSGQDLKDTVAAAMAGGAKKAFSDKSIWNAIGVGGGVAFGTNLANKFINANTQGGLALTANPLTGGSYGSMAESLINADEQKYVAGGEGIATIVGGILGGVLGKSAAGATMGAAAAGSIASAFGNYDLGQTSIQSSLTRDLVNNRMRIEALRGTSAPAYAIQSAAMGGHTLKDIEVPFITAVAKATATYNDNTKAMSSLTKNIVNFSQSAQVDLGSAVQIASSASMLSRDKNFSFDYAKQLFNTYGTTDYSGAFNSAIGFRQAGFSANKSMELAVQYQSASPGFRQAAANFFGNASQRAQADLIAQSMGGNTEALYDRDNPLHQKYVKQALGIRGKYLSDIKKGNFSDALLQANIYNLISGGQDITSAPIFDALDKKLINKSVGMTGVQSAINKVMNDFRNNRASQGDTDKSLIKLSTGFNDASQAVGTLTKDVYNLSGAMQELSRGLMSSFNSGFSSYGAGSTQSKKH